MADVRLDDAAIQRLLKSPDGPVGRAVLSATIRVERRAKRLLSRKGTGRVYRRGVTKSGRGRFHQASAPGQPPAVDTGLLRASITRQLRYGTHGLEGRVGTRVKYARYLEFGTSKMRPRPFLRPALEAADPRKAAQLNELDRFEREARQAARARAVEIRARRRTLLAKGEEA